MLQFSQVIGAEVGQGVLFEPGPKIFDRVEVRCVVGQQRHLYGATCGVGVIAHSAALVPRRTVPTISNLRLRCTRSALKNSMIRTLLMAPSCSRAMKFVQVRPATADSCFQLK